MYKLYHIMDLSLKQIPEEVRKIILREQVKLKEKHGTNQYSISLTIYKIIKEWNNNCKPLE